MLLQSQIRFASKLFVLSVLTGCYDSAEPVIPELKTQIEQQPNSPDAEPVTAADKSEPDPNQPVAKSGSAAAQLPIGASSKEPIEPLPGISASGEDGDSPAITAFLKKFDDLSARGFVPTLRSGSTGIGYTLETMLDIEENNSPGGDFMGMEIKAFRDDDLHMDDSEKMNLFLKEPAWIDGLKHSDRVKTYGYVDDNGRQAMYSTVQIKQNSHGFVFRVDRNESRLYMQFKGEDIAFWTFDILARRLKEKHSEAVFVAAHAKGKGKLEQFHYYSVTWCRNPDVAAFVDLIQTGDVMLELRMHLKETGSVRNHGSAFRIKQNRIPKLYAETDQVRP